MKMKIHVLSESQPGKLAAIVREANEHFLNSVRRAINSEVPAFAIDEVTFHENTSPMFNEYLANRLALVPLTFEEGAQPDAQISLSLEAEANEGPRVVYSRELQSSDPVIRVFCERIPLIKLGKGQKLKFEASVVQGRPRQHAKFQSALASYGALPEFKVSGKCDKCGACVAACPKKLISPQIKLAEVEKCILCENCAETCPKGAITVRPKPGEFVLFVESFNNLTAREQLERALKLVGEKLDFVEKAVKNPKFLEKLEEEAKVNADAKAADAAEAAAAAATAKNEGVNGAEGEAGQAGTPQALVAEEPFDEVELVEQTAKEKKDRKKKLKKEKGKEEK